MNKVCRAQKETKESQFMNFFLLLHRINKRNKQKEKTNKGEIVKKQNFTLENIKKRDR